MARYHYDARGHYRGKSYGSGGQTLHVLGQALVNSVVHIAKAIWWLAKGVHKLSKAIRGGQH